MVIVVRLSNCCDANETVVKAEGQKRGLLIGEDFRHLGGCVSLPKGLIIDRFEYDGIAGNFFLG